MKISLAFRPMIVAAVFGGGHVPVHPCWRILGSETTSCLFSSSGSVNETDENLPDNEVWTETQGDWHSKNRTGPRAETQSLRSLATECSQTQLSTTGMACGCIRRKKRDPTSQARLLHRLAMVSARTRRVVSFHSLVEREFFFASVFSHCPPRSNDTEGPVHDSSTLS